MILCCLQAGNSRMRKLRLPYVGIRFLGIGPDSDVGGELPWLVGKTLKDLFRAAGSIVRADINIGLGGRAKGSGTVIFKTAKDAQNAIQMYNGYDWYGRILEVREDRYAGLTSGGFRGGFRGTSKPLADQRLAPTAAPAAHGGPGYGEPQGMLPTWSTAHEDLVELFETTGVVEQAKIPFDCARSNGAGVVQFGQRAEAETAIVVLWTSFSTTVDTHSPQKLPRMIKSLQLPKDMVIRCLFRIIAFTFSLFFLSSPLPKSTPPSSSLVIA
ncbi:hypothetical protein M422DRAFT_782085 [Sphaerobolus stellatus SS14]|uniref:RRM domain-containing protein n=1 Tax=Sphaerobolus stellatus (strain SS14) TaxID=990650 RepID=A0A0C9VH85_SPHS4|nr:hypothetical protein M422DRAFT_782085 [Sphaerobolus stellatus SS14]